MDEVEGLAPEIGVEEQPVDQGAAPETAPVVADMPDKFGGDSAKLAQSYAELERERTRLAQRLAELEAKQAPVVETPAAPTGPDPAYVALVQEHYADLLEDGFPPSEDGGDTSTWERAQRKAAKEYQRSQASEQRFNALQSILEETVAGSVVEKRVGAIINQSPLLAALAPDARALVNQAVAQQVAQTIPLSELHTVDQAGLAVYVQGLAAQEALRVLLQGAAHAAPAMPGVAPAIPQPPTMLHPSSTARGTTVQAPISADEQQYIADWSPALRNAGYTDAQIRAKARKIFGGG
jgi:hypothetical protein